MKKRVFFTGLAAAFAFSAIFTAAVFAQQGQRGTPESRVEELAKAVTLTADQKTQILKIFTDADAARQGGGRGGGGFGGGGMLPAAAEKVLNPDQVKKWRAYSVKQSVDRTITRIDEAVTLTADQKVKIVPILEKQVTAQMNYMADMRDMRAKGETPDMDAMRAKMTELRDAMVKSLESLLTKEQMEKYNAMPRGGGGRRGQ